MFAAPSVCDRAGLDPLSATPTNVRVTHLGSSDEGGWEVPCSIPAFVVHHLFSPAECAAVIAATPGAGPGFMDEHDVAARYRGRTCTRLASHDPSMAQLVERRLRDLNLLPIELDGGRLLGVSPRWRHVHYKGAQRGHQEHHIDGREPFEPVPMPAAGGAPLFAQSRLTAMVYLNTAGVDYEGGATTFLDDALRPRPGGMHRPVAGDALIFYQEAGRCGSLLLHEGSAVTSGDKRMMRTVVDYGHFSRADCRRCAWEEIADAREAAQLAELDRRLALSKCAAGGAGAGADADARKAAVLAKARATGALALAAALRDCPPRAQPPAAPAAAGGRGAQIAGSKQGRTADEEVEGGGVGRSAPTCNLSRSKMERS